MADDTNATRARRLIDVLFIRGACPFMAESQLGAYLCDAITAALDAKDAELVETREGEQVALRQRDAYERDLTRLRDEVATLRRERDELREELAQVQAFRADPFRGIRTLLGEDDADQDDEAIAGAVVAILLTRHETVRRKKAAESALTAAHARVAVLEAALREVDAKLRLFWRDDDGDGTRIADAGHIIRDALAGTP